MSGYITWNAIMVMHVAHLLGAYILNKNTFSIKKINTNTSPIIYGKYKLMYIPRVSKKVSRVVTATYTNNNSRETNSDLKDETTTKTTESSSRHQSRNKCPLRASRSGTRTGASTASLRSSVRARSICVLWRESICVLCLITSSAGRNVRDC